jgi:hypothetical protein
MGALVTGAAVLESGARVIGALLVDTGAMVTVSGLVVGALVTTVLCVGALVKGERVVTGAFKLGAHSCWALCMLIAPAAKLPLACAPIATHP